MGGMLWGLQSSPVRSGHRYVNHGLIVGHSTSAIFFVELCYVVSCGCFGQFGAVGSASDSRAKGP